MIVLCHRDTPTNATGLPWLPLCSQGNVVQRSRCGRLPNLQRAQRNFDVCDDRRSADIHMSLRGSAPSFLQGSHFGSKSKPSLGTIRRNEKATFYALARSGREREARGRRFAKWLYRASCCKHSRRIHVMSHRKVVLVTGASSGFGNAIAGLLAKKDLEVFGTSRHPSANGSMPGVSMGPLDVRMDESVRACVDTILDRTGHLDILVNNAGYVQGGAS